VKKVTASILFLLTTLIVPTASHALTVKLYQATISQVDVASPPTPFKTFTSGSPCVNLAGTHGNKITIADLGGTSQACVVNGLTTDEVRVFRAKIQPLQAGTYVMEISTDRVNELVSGAAGGYSFAAALKNVAALSSGGSAKTANGILFRAKANGNDINSSGTVSVTCGTTSAGTTTWTSSSTCTKTESESLTLAANSNITFVSRYEFKTTASNDFFTFPASGHALISKVKDVDGGLIEIFISLGTQTAVQYPFTNNFTSRFFSPLSGSRASLRNSIPVKADLLQATGLVSNLPLNCESILSNAIEGDNKCSIAVPTSLQWRDIDVLKAVWTFAGGDCRRSFQFMIELADFRRFFFDNAKALPDDSGSDCTTTPTFSGVDVADRQLKAPNWDLSQVGGVVNDTYGKSLTLVGQEFLRQIAITLGPHPDNIDQRVLLSEFVVNGDTYRPLTSVDFAPVPTLELPLQGVEYRVTREGDPSCPVKILSQDLGQIRISGGKYIGDLDTASLCGVGHYSIRVHLNGDPRPIPGSTDFFLE
jgi:hypothetical protein